MTPSQAIRTRKPRGQGATRRGEILDAAKTLFLDEGFEHATMRRIAAAVGVSPTALYLHFADKEAILSAIAEDFFAELFALLQAAQGSNVASLATFKNGLRTYIEFGLSRPSEYRLTFLSDVMQGPGRPCGGKLARADQAFGILESHVAGLMRAGIFRLAPTILVAEAIWCCLHGVTGALLNMRQAIETAPPALIDEVIDMAVRGFVNKPC